MRESSLVPLSHVVSLVTNRTDGSKDASMPYVGLEHIPTGGSSLLGVGSAADSISTNGMFSSGDILFGKLRPQLRKCVRVQTPGYCSTDILVLRPNAGIDPTYAGYIAQSDVVFGTAIRTEEGTKMPRCSWHDLKRVTVFLPQESAIQKKIAAILKSIDTAIEKTEVLIAKHQQIKVGLMHDLFTRGVLPNGQLRPPRSEAPELYQETVLGWIPKEWRAERLGAMLEESGGYLQTGPFGSQLHASEYSEEGVPVVMPQDINDGLIDEVAIARISEGRAATLARHRLKVGDIIIARRGELSRAAAISDLHANWVCGTGCFLLRLGRTGLNHFFFSLAYRFDYVQRQIAGMQVGSTMPSLNNSVMSRVLFPRPSPSEQGEITRRLHAVEIEIAGIAHQAEKLQKQKIGLMQDLLTGRVSVPAAT